MTVLFKEDWFLQTVEYDYRAPSSPGFPGVLIKQPGRSMFGRPTWEEARWCAPFSIIILTIQYRHIEY